MAHSKETEHYKLPIMTQNDHPDFLTDYNGAMYTLDNAVYLNEYSHEELKKLVESLSLNMDNINDEFEVIKAKVEALVNLEDNPVFIELKGQVESLNTNVTELVERVNNNDTQIAEIEQSIELINTDLNTLHTSFDNLEAEVTNNTEDIAALNSSFAEMNKNMGFMQADINELKTDVSAMKITVSRHDSDIAELKRDQESDNERLIDLELNVGRNTNDIAKITQAIYVVNKELSDRIDSVVQTAAGSTVELKELTDRVDGLSTVVDQNTTDIDTLESRVTELETTGPDLSEIQGEIDAIKIEQDVQDDLITRNSDDIAIALTTMSGINVEHTLIKQNIESLNTSIYVLERDVENLKTVNTTDAMRVISLFPEHPLVLVSNSNVVTGSTTLHGNITDLEYSITFCSNGLFLTKCFFNIPAPIVAGNRYGFEVRLEDIGIYLNESVVMSQMQTQFFGTILPVNALQMYIFKKLREGSENIYETYLAVDLYNFNGKADNITMTWAYPQLCHLNKPIMTNNKSIQRFIPTNENSGIRIMEVNENVKA